jgi:hypothetical protein
MRHVSLDKNVVDAWDIPVLRIETKYTDNEFNMARDVVDTSIALVEAASKFSKKYDPNLPRLQYSRTRHLPDGRQSEDQRAESMEPESRCEEPVPWSMEAAS